jgi:lysine 2,3-aminomutase
MDRRSHGPWKDIGDSQWNDWHWQVRSSLQTLESLQVLLPLTRDEVGGIRSLEKRLPLRISPYWALLMNPNNPNCPIRRQTIPLIQETNVAPSDYADPCDEDAHSPVPNLVHRYPDRVLLLVTDMCAMYCRYCTRGRLVGAKEVPTSQDNLEQVFAYLSKTKQVRDVLLSGGDPLMVSDARLEYIIQRLRKIPHIEFIRIGSRVPVTLPQRVDAEFVAMLKRNGPIWMSLHFNHYREVTPEVREACNRLADAGVPLGSQTVLLKGINDSAYVMKKLFHELLKIRVRPYYIYQADPVTGTEHLRTTIATGIAIMEKLRGHTSGYAVPTYVVDAPGGGGKIPVGPEYVVEKSEGRVVLRNYEGKTFEYLEPELRPAMPDQV